MRARGSSLRTLSVTGFRLGGEVARVKFEGSSSLISEPVQPGVAFRAWGLDLLGVGRSPG